METPTRTLAEALAIAILKGDMVAAYALSDKLIEEREQGDKVKEKLVSMRQNGPIAGYELYGTPEFLAFANRIGLHWDLSTIEVTIRLPSEGRVEIHQTYAARNVSPGLLVAPVPPTPNTDPLAPNED